jgi:hypothetical protein
MQNFFTWLDQNSHRKRGRLASQLFPIITCLVLFALFMGTTYEFLQKLINPYTQNDVQIILNIKDISVGFFLYFVTAIDYALIIGRMQVTNTGARARFVMNVFTCLGCFVGVSLVLFLWSFTREVPLLIIPILIFAGGVMIKLAYEGIGYFEHANYIPEFIRVITIKFLELAHNITKVFTFWIPELGAPKTTSMNMMSLAKWAFLLPFIIGIDDLVGYMGAMTIYNAFGLIFGIYLADIFIDILIFVSPKLTKQLVENALLSLMAAYAFIYLAYKSYSETFHYLEEYYHASIVQLAVIVAVFILTVLIGGELLKRKKSITTGSEAVH